MKDRSGLFLLVLALVWRSVFALRVLADGYLVPPGDDASFHVARVQEILSGSYHLFYQGYPLGAHWLFALAARLTGESALSIVNHFAVWLIVLPIIPIYFLGSRLWRSPLAGGLAALIWSLFALAPLRAYGDGTYPNLLAASVFLPLALYFLLGAAEEGRSINWLWFWVTAVLVVLTHNLTLVYALTAIAVWAVYQLVQWLQPKKSRPSRVKALGVMFFGLAVIASVLWRAEAPILSPLFAGLLNHSLSSTLGSFTVSVSFATFIEIHGVVLVFWGLLSSTVLVFSKERLSAKLLILPWIIGLLFLTFSPGLGLPGRFVRELALPFALVSGWFLARIVQYRYPAQWLKVTAVLALTVILTGFWLQSFDKPFGYNTRFKSLERVQLDQEGSVRYLQTHTTSDMTVLANNSDPYLEFLIPAHVITIRDPLELADVDLATVNYIAVGARPPLSPDTVYPYYLNFDPIHDQLTATALGAPVFTDPPGNKIWLIDSSTTY